MLVSTTTKYSFHGILNSIIWKNRLPLTRFDVMIGDEDEEYKDKEDDSFGSDGYDKTWYTVKPDIHAPKTDEELLEELERPIYSDE